MAHIKSEAFGQHQVVDDSGQVLHEAWDKADAERFLFELRADAKRREDKDAAERWLGL